LSTAYVAGKRVGVVREDELDVGQDYVDEYERTKMEAEQLVQEFGRRHPTAIFRPSIVVGDSRTGDAARFQGFYEALVLYRRLFWKGLVFRGSLLVLPADPDAIIDIVPIDYVLDALFFADADGEEPGTRLSSHLGEGQRTAAGRADANDF
jgi:thioester reductase-like protein